MSRLSIPQDSTGTKPSTCHRAADLLNRVDDFNGTTVEPDTLRWKDNIDGQFSVKRVCKMEERVKCRGQPKIWRNLWNSPSPTKVKCFTWLVVKGTCLTLEVLKKKRGHHSFQVLLMQWDMKLFALHFYNTTLVSISQDNNDKLNYAGAYCRFA